MALLFTEGFDSYPNPIPLWYKWNRQTTAPRITGRTGYGMQPTYADVVPKTLANSTSLILGFAIKPTNTGDLNYVVATFNNQADQAVATIGMMSYNTVYISDYLNTNTDVTTFALPLNQWSYLEVKLLNAINAAPAGSLLARGTVGPLVSTFYTSPATRNFNSGANNKVCSCVFYANGNQMYDDVYICDTTGAYNNNFLGAVKINTFFPTANGFVTQFTPVGAGTNYQAVNNPVLTPDVAYVESNVIGDKDLYDGGGLVVAPGDSVAAVVLNAVIRKDKSGYGHVRLPIRFSATDNDGNNYYVPSGYQSMQRHLDVNPITNMPWTEDDFNNLQGGVKIS